MGSQENKFTQMWNWFPLPRIEVFTDNKKARKLCRKLCGHDVSLMPEGGQVIYFNEGPGPDVAVIVFDEEKVKSVPFSERVSIVAHECSHIVDDLADTWGEKQLSTEARAYLLDAAVAAVVEQLGEAWFTRKEERR